MPDLTEQHENDLALTAKSAAMLPSQHAVIPTLCKMASVDPATGRKANTALLLDLLRRDKEELRTVFEVAGRMLAGDTRPDGQVVSVGNAAHDPMMMLAHDIIQLSMRGKPDRAWAQVQQHPAGQQAAVLFVLAA
ncbi:hypothetical protein K7472_31960 [Streptomyces sp. PTM05]|uniref:Uncharacterized protein n=1 Tax=Streptantibioticus parmotrematis TaxID=2873249 RepID=A0ABS7R4H4_9ACTN|nr:hypothetical protein [Streptantibioticus parmotrematis]MBY8889425.1 hypothetical protein [Streptantibioticus parmotrematis]